MSEVDFNKLAIFSIFEVVHEYYNSIVFQLQE